MYMVKAGKRTKRQAYTHQLGGRIETIRVGMGIEPKEMAKRLNLKWETYRSYEEGRRCAPPYVLADLCRLSGHHPWFVLTGEPERNSPTAGVKPQRLRPVSV